MTTSTLVLPALRHLLLQRPERVEVVGRGERLVEDVDREDPVDAVHPPVRGDVRPAQDVPAAEPDHDRPRVDLDECRRAGVGA